MSAAAEQIRAYLRSRKYAPSPGSIQGVRDSYEELAKQFHLLPDTSVEQTKINGVAAEWIVASKATKDRVIIYLHGGCYVFGSCNTHRALAARISAVADAAVLLLDYRLAPEHPFPAAIEDACAAYRWLLNNGFTPDQIAISGDSAGGGLTMATLISLRDAGDKLPAAAALISAWTDLTNSGESITTLTETDPWMVPSDLTETAPIYLAGAEAKTPLASPLFADLRGLPPLLIQVGSDEILLDDSTRLAKIATAAGVEVTLDIWPGMWHVWHAFAERLPEGEQAIVKLGSFLREKMRNKS
jgi:epsilon-lactone hydrolase